MGDLRENLPLQLEDELFAAADVDNSGTIDFQEFVALMLGYLRSSDWRTQVLLLRKRASPKPIVPFFGASGLFLHIVCSCRVVSTCCINNAPGELSQDRHGRRDAGAGRRR